jgi:murein DD-endopeptidase MepM/ murein hydrolase activator NlpD
MNDASPAPLQRIHFSVPASLPGDAPLRRSRQRRTSAADQPEVTSQIDETHTMDVRPADSVATEIASSSALRSERRARRIAAPVEEAPGCVASTAAPVAEAERPAGRRARRASAAPSAEADARRAVSVNAPTGVDASTDFVSDWMGIHASEASVVAESAPSRRARRARAVVADVSNALDVAESAPVSTRRSRRGERTAVSDEAVPVLTLEPRVTLEAAPVAANPSDLVVPSEETVGQSFSIVQDDPTDVAAHNAIPDEREAVSVMVEDVPVEPVMATVSPSIVLDPDVVVASSHEPLADTAVPITVATTTSITAVAHLSEQAERAAFVPRTEIESPPVPAPVAASSVPAGIARRKRAGRVAAKSFSFAAFSVAGLLTLATSLPANALLSADDVAEQKVLVTQQDSGSAGQTQTVAASGETALETVQRDSYEAMSAIDAAKALGIQPEASFTNDPNGTIQWPFAIGVHIGSGYGARPGCPIGCSTNHKGQDFNPGYGAPIQSIADGVVIESTDSGGAFGVKIVIEHVIDGQVIHSLYGHMIQGSRTVEVGDPVTVGQVIGQTGNTGRSTGPHLHFEIMLNGTEHVDPLAWLYANAN